MHIFQYTHVDLVGEFEKRYGKGAYHASAIFRHLYRDMNTNLAGAPEVAASPEFALQLGRDLQSNIGRVVQAKEQDAVWKFVTRLDDGLLIESVVLPMARHHTVCVSSQVGCRMGCTFCRTGRNGLTRDLTVAEIVGQVFVARQKFGPRLRNVVFMGMGEPFDNCDSVLRAIDVISEPRGLNIARRRITVSTVGLEGGIRKFSAFGKPPARLAVSLNAPNDRLRSQIMPVNRRLPLQPLRDVLRAYPLKKKDVIMISYVLMPGVNDHTAHADQLARYLEPLPCKVNLIPCNPGPESPYRAPTEDELTRFRKRLIAKHVNIQLRSTRGQELMAACGQLSAVASVFQAPA